MSDDPTTADLLRLAQEQVDLATARERRAQIRYDNQGSACPQADEHHLMESCGSCAYRAVVPSQQVSGSDGGVS